MNEKQTKELVQRAIDFAKGELSELRELALTAQNKALLVAALTFGFIQGHKTASAEFIASLESANAGVAYGKETCDCEHEHEP